MWMSWLHEKAQRRDSRDGAGEPIQGAQGFIGARPSVLDLGSAGSEGMPRAWAFQFR